MKTRIGSEIYESRTIYSIDSIDDPVYEFLLKADGCEIETSSTHQFAIWNSVTKEASIVYANEIIPRTHEMLVKIG